jgi:hypothetical protein
MLERTETGPSKFKARGRDVHVPRTELDYDADSRKLSFPVFDTGPDFLLMNQYRELTAQEVEIALGVSKPTALKRLRDAGWEIVTPGTGRNPDMWGFPHGSAGWDDGDPFA